MSRDRLDGDLGSRLVSGTREPFQQEALLCAGSSVQVGAGRGDGGRGTAQPHPVETATSSRLTGLLPLQGRPSAQGPGDVFSFHSVCLLPGNSGSFPRDQNESDKK